MLDEVGLLHVEVELAGTRLHRAATHFFGIDAVLYRGQHLVQAVVARLDIGVAHARGGGEFVGFAPPRAGTGVTCLEGAHPVHQETGQHAILDELGVLGRHSFVIDVDGSPGVALQAFVHRTDCGIGNQLAHLVVEHRGLLGHRGGLQQVAARLVEDDAAKAALHDDRQGTARTGGGAQLHQGLTSGGEGQLARIDALGVFPTHQGAGGLVAHALLAPFPGDGLGHDAVVVATITDLQPFAVEDLHFLLPAQHVAGELAHLVALGAGRGIHGVQIGDLLLQQLVRRQGQGHRMAVGETGEIEGGGGHHGVTPVLGRQQGDDAQQLVTAGLVGVAVKHLVAVAQAHADAEIEATADVLYLAGEQTELAAALALHKQLGKVGTQRQGVIEHVAGDGGGQQGEWGHRISFSDLSVCFRRPALCCYGASDSLLQTSTKKSL